MYELRLPVEQPYRHLLVSYLNVVLSDNEEFWCTDLRSKVIAKFGRETFADSEMEPGYNLRNMIAPGGDGIVELLRRILGSLGVVLTKKSRSELMELGGQGFSFVDVDIASWDPKVKQASFINNFSGLMLQNLAKGASPSEAKRLLHSADLTFQRAIGSSATNVLAYEAWGDVSLKLGQMFVEKSNKVRRDLLTLSRNSSKA